jgi:hypothetical protein
MTGNEFEFSRPPPTSRYRDSGKILIAPSNLLAETTAALRSVPNREAACLWLGHTDATTARVEALVIPRQANRRLNYSISAEAMQSVAEYAGPQEWRLLANIHSHPGVDVEHSVYDDQMMPSCKALSLVFPRYGQWKADWPVGIGVHEYIDGYWYLLSEAAAPGRIQWAPEMPLVTKDLR